MSNSHNIFISFKKTYNNQITTDHEYAKIVYEKLIKAGYKPFFSDVEIIASGHSNYIHAIDDSLNSAKLLIYICSNPIYLESSYVKYEWSSFSNEIRNGNKPKGHIFGLINNVKHSEIPYGLRGFETFSFEMIDQMVDSVKKILPLEKKQNKQLNIIDSQIERFKTREKNIFQRKEFNHFFEFIIENKNQLGIITYEKNISASALLYNETLRWHQLGYNLLYIDEKDNYKNIINQIKLNEYNHIYIVFDKVFKNEDFELIKDLLSNENVSIICAVPREFYDLAAEIQHEFEETNYHLDVLDEAEALEYIQQVAKETGFTLAGNLETILLLPTLKEIRTPFVLKLVITSINNFKGYTDKDYNATDIFEIIENSLIREYKGIDLAIEEIFTIILEKGVNRITTSEVKDYDEFMNILSTQSLIKKTNKGYLIANREYMNYRLALTLINTEGLKVKPEDFFRFEDVKPYYAYLYFLEIKEINFHIIKTMNDEQKEKFLSLMISEKEYFNQLVEYDFLKTPLSNLLIRFRKSGLYSLANIIIEACEINNLPSTNQFDYISEKILIHYFQTGNLLESDQQLWQTKYQQAYVLFCLDDLEKSEQMYEVAYNLMIEEQIYNTSLLFDYMQLLLDYGNKEKVKEMLDFAATKCDVDDDDYIVRYNMLKGIIYQEELIFGMAEVHLKTALKKSFEIFNLKKIQIIFGELGRLLIYKGEYLKAENYLYKNLKIAQSLSDFNGIAISSKMLALIKLLNQNYDSAYKYYGYSEMFCEHVNNNWRLYKTRLFLDLLYDNRIDKYQRDISAIELIKSNSFHAGTLPLVALLKYKLNNSLEEACEILDQAIEISTLINSNVGYCVSKTIKNTLLNQPLESNSEMSKYVTDLSKTIIEFQANKPSLSNLPLPNYQYRQIKSEKIKLIMVDVKFTEDIFEYTSDIASTKYVMWRRHRDYKDTYAFIETTYDIDNSGYLYTWLIYYTDDKKVIGTIDLSYSDKYQEVEIGYILNTKYWQKGIASKAVKLVIDFVKTQLKINKIIGIVLSENIMSKKLLLKNGFIHIKTIENYKRISDTNSKTGELFAFDVKR